MEPDAGIDSPTEKERKIYEDINRINFIQRTRRNEPFCAVNVENPHINLVWHLLVTFMRFKGIKISDDDTQIQYVNMKGETFSMFKEEKGIGIPKKDLRKVAPWIDGDGMYHYTSLEADGRKFRIKGLDDYAKLNFYKDYWGEEEIIAKLSIESGFKGNKRFDVVKIERYPFEDIESIIKGNEPEENFLWETMKKIFTGLGYDMSEDGNLIIIGEELVLLKFGKGFITLSSYERMNRKGISTKDFYYNEIMGLDMETDSEGKMKEGVKFKIVLASVTNFEYLVIETKPNARSIRGMKRIKVRIGNALKHKEFKTHYVRIGKEDEIQLDGYNINYLN